MNRFSTRLMGATATPPPAPPKARSNENLDKIDMSLGEEPSRTELEWEEVWVEPNTVVCGGRGGWVLEFSCGWAEPSEGRWGRGGGGELAGVGVKSEGLGDPLGRTMSEGAEGALGWDFGGDLGVRTLFPLEGRHHTGDPGSL